EQNIEIIFRISLLEKVNNALIVDKEKRVNRVLRHTLVFHFAVRGIRTHHGASLHRCCGAKKKGLRPLFLMENGE
ncbi:hypothetical protein, partial [Caecibacteroides pullorum]|uniref:hypothetical protein n=1 Tax=Caecibacteroides pullorum TaxID=2725562 RepID=UPI00195DE830